jgi:RNA polymerase sigma-70 factor (ECF subfamily)
MTDLHPEVAQKVAPEMPPDALGPEFRELFESQAAFVCRSLERLGVRSADVDDVAQELFVTVRESLAKWDRERPIRPWLFGFATRFAANYRRLGWHRGRAYEDAPDSPKIVRKLDAKYRVLTALEALDADKRAVLVMHDLEELSAPEIAEVLSIPLNTVYSRLRMARDGFRAALEPKGGAGD